jgi:hypothetical protein
MMALGGRNLRRIGVLGVVPVLLGCERDQIVINAIRRCV